MLNPLERSLLLFQEPPVLQPFLAGIHVSYSYNSSVMVASNYFFLILRVSSGLGLIKIKLLASCFILHRQKKKYLFLSFCHSL